MPPSQHVHTLSPGSAAPCPPQTCPFLLRVFPRTPAHHRLEEFGRRGEEPKPEIKVYTWHDATLREVCDLIQEKNEPARSPTARISFALVYPASNGRNIMRQIGVLHSTRAGKDDASTLKSHNLQTGDFLSVAIY